ncbi:MAG: 16S rRNA (cytosine(1402)-N(4))-methyltransferase RsmH [Christensenellaceae bacterium]|jgi:16S rRNA (cytosine1402-N4)-methyltransferase|nr:16S rRNA (cytosine(1402)-N(4))-methyltransferase RsmH [Christensenellaceae bacterium]
MYNVTYHVPVLTKEILNGLDDILQKSNSNQKIVVDATAGGLGHSSEIAKRLKSIDKLICIDKDSEAFKHNADRIKSDCKVIFINDGFENITQILKNNNIEKIDAVLADLGVSSHQIDVPERGFSYTKDGPLDMRMNQTQQRDAHHVVNNYTATRLEEVIKTFGEERYARQITSAIVNARPIETTMQLAKIITDAVPGNYYKTGGHPAKRTFQAIRMEVNRELEVLEKFVYDATHALKDGGRIAIITFHSLEDRIVKHAFKYLESPCVCPPKTPKCICGKVQELKILTKKPIVASNDEVNVNPRASSAKLRIGEKVA